MKSNPRPTRGLKRGFTLIELLIVIAILALILSMTVMAVNFGRETDRIRGGASQIQSFIAGGRDRAIYSGQPVGIRLFLDNTEFTDENGATLAGNRRTVSSMAYTDPSQTWSDGTIQVQRVDVNNDGVVDTGYMINGAAVGQLAYAVAGVGTGWWELKRRGMLIDGISIQIPAGGTSYPISTALIDTSAAPTTVQKLLLQIPFRDQGDTPEGTVQAFASGGPVDYSLQLPPAILPSAPSVLPDSVVIDLDGSQLPASWTPVTTSSEFSQFMDIVFSPRGTVIGDAASSGVIHLYVCDQNDSITIKDMIALSAGNTDFDLTGLSGFLGGAKLITPDVFGIDLPEPNGDPANGTIEDSNGEIHEITDRRIVTLFTRTGSISVHPVNPVDGDGNMLADDPYLFAETGEEAN